jgi:two-component system NarL family sensor kinase
VVTPEARQGQLPINRAGCPPSVGHIGEITIRPMGRVLSTRMAHRLAWAVGGLSVALAATCLTLVVVNWSTLLPAGMEEQGPFLALFLAFIPFSLVGALILFRRPDHRIGWLFSVIGLSFLLGGAAQQYAIYGLLTRSEHLVGSLVMSWLAEWILYPGVVGALLLLLVFPDGQLLSKRWIPFAAAVTLGVLLLAVGSAFAPGHVSVPTVRNPFAIKALSFLDETRNPGWFGLVLGPIGGLVAIVIRFRRSKGDERRKLKLFAYAAGFLAAALAVVSIASGPPRQAGNWSSSAWPSRSFPSRAGSASSGTASTTSIW